MARSRLFNFLTKPSPGGFITSLVGGAALDQASEHFLKGRSKPPGLAPQQKRNKVAKVAQSFHPDNLEMVTPSNVKRAANVGKVVYDAARSEELQQHLESVPPEAMQKVQEMVKTEAAHGVQQFGLNQMLGAPAKLVPGWPGFALRTAMKAKTFGNVGHTLSEIERVTGSEDGPFMKIVNAHNGNDKI